VLPVHLDRVTRLQLHIASAFVAKRFGGGASETAITDICSTKYVLANPTLVK